MGRGPQNKVNILEVPIVGIIAFRDLHWSHPLPETLNAHYLGKLQVGIREILITSGPNSLALQRLCVYIHAYLSRDEV